MEVPRWPQPSFTLDLHERTSAALSAPGSLDEVDRTEQRDGAAEDPPRAESTAESVESLMMEPPEPEDPTLSSQDSFCEDSWVSEETSAEEPGKNSEEQAAAAAAERAAQRQLLAVDELVQSERNYLRMLQVSSVTIRSNLRKIQVAKLPEEPPPADHRAADERVPLSPAAASSRPGQPVPPHRGRDGRVQPPPQPVGPGAARSWRPCLPADSL